MVSPHHSPPAVRIAVRPDAGLAAAVLAVAGVGTALLGYGCVASAAPGYWWALLLWLGILAGAWRAWQGLPRGVLQWDGAAWDWQAAGSAAVNNLNSVAPSALSIAFDVQFGLGMLVTISGKRYFFCCMRSHNLAHWGDVRRAVYSSALAVVTP